MKRILLAACAALLATSAHATILMYTPNDAGGTIQFSDMPCNKMGAIPSLSRMNGLSAVAIDSGGNAIAFGCYHYDEPNIVMTWENGQTRWYNPSGITTTAAGRAMFARAKASE